MKKFMLVVSVLALMLFGLNVNADELKGSEVESSKVCDSCPQNVLKKTVKCCDGKCNSEKCDEKTTECDKCDNKTAPKKAMKCGAGKCGGKAAPQKTMNCGAGKCG
jgi:uncharacterized low-complexity protein